MRKATSVWNRKKLGDPRAVMGGGAMVLVVLVLLSHLERQAESESSARTSPSLKTRTASRFRTGAAPSSAERVRDQLRACIHELGPLRPEVCLAEHCEIFPAHSGVSRPNTYVGRALFCAGRLPGVRQVMELGTETGSGTRQIALGGEAAGKRPVVGDRVEADSLRIITIEARRERGEQTRAQWEERFPTISWQLGGTVDSPQIRACFERHYKINPEDAVPEPIERKLLLQHQPVDAMFVDTTGCTGMAELEVMTESSPDTWLLIAHDLDKKYRSEEILRIPGWEEVFRTWDKFTNANTDYCECRPEGYGPTNDLHGNGDAQVGVFFNADAYDRMHGAARN